MCLIVLNHEQDILMVSPDRLMRLNVEKLETYCKSPASQHLAPDKNTPIISNSFRVLEEISTMSQSALRFAWMSNIKSVYFSRNSN